jgi:hypothetical protein
MSALLANLHHLHMTDPAKKEQFFDPVKEMPKVRKYILDRECPDLGFPPSCDVNLFFGFFFDGTNNNMKRDEAFHTHSNIARLYRAFPGGPDKNGSEAWPDLQSKYHNSFFRTYVPGVGTKFEEVGDSGEGFSLIRDDRPKGLAFCYKGENRILWALVEALNHVHEYYTDNPLIRNDEFKASFNKLALPAAVQPTEKLEAVFAKALKRLHAALDPYLPLDAGPKSADKGKVKNIYVSMFGFSRGATEARAFANWFIWLCQLDAKISGRSGLSLCSIPVTIDFMGLFDTVASVGVAASTPVLNLFADGHGAWADAEKSLRIPLDPGPTQCLHLVSAHEVRRSFPLDSVLYLGRLPENCTEIVFPGVHSDIGGGYRPLEQGRGKHDKGDDLISRITLAVMYRAARLAGVPLKLEDAPQKVKNWFRIDPAVIQAFNAYLQFCGARHDKQAISLPLHEIMAQQHKLYIQWRKQMVGKMKDLPNVAKSDRFDLTDIEMADRELKDEITYFERWRRDQGRASDIENAPFMPEWIALDHYWDQLTSLPAAVIDLFELYVHDSRAWFKPLGKDIPDLQYEMEQLVKKEEQERQWESANGAAPDRPNPYALSHADRAQLMKYKPYRGKPNFQDGLEPSKSGREPFWMGGGFLRYRRIYMGSDSFKPSGAHYAGLAPLHGAGEQRLAVQHSAADPVAA